MFMDRPLRGSTGDWLSGSRCVAPATMPSPAILAANGQAHSRDKELPVTSFKEGKSADNECLLTPFVKQQ
jgi:hypothetical protein